MPPKKSPKESRKKVEKEQTQQRQAERKASKPEDGDSDDSVECLGETNFPPPHASTLKTVPPPPNPKPKPKLSSVAATPIVMATSTPIGFLKPFDPTNDDFEVWESAFRAFLLGNNIDPDNEKKRSHAIFLSMVGLQTFSLLQSFCSPDTKYDRTLKELLTLVRDHYKPAPKALAERFKFMNRRQQQGEKVSVFLASLRELAIHCQFSYDLDTRVRDQFIFGIHSEKIQRSLFTKDDNVKLAEVFQTGSAMETAETNTAMVRQQQNSSNSNSNPEHVHQTANYRSSSQRNNNNSRNGFYPPQQRPQTQQQFGFNRNQAPNRNSGNQNNRNPNTGQRRASPPPTATQQQPRSSARTCQNCGSNQHSHWSKCPHRDHQCSYCAKNGHYPELCRSRLRETNPSPTNALDIEPDIDPEPFDIHHINSTAQVGNVKKIIQLDVFINGVSTSMELDTGCETSVLAEDVWKHELGAPPLQKSKAAFRTYTGNIFHPIGDLKCSLQHNGQQLSYTIPVGKGSSLFGRDLLNQIKIDWENVQQQVNPVNSTDTVNSLLTGFQDILTAPCSVTTVTDRIVHSLTQQQIEVLPVTSSLIRKATSRDPVLSKTLQLVLHGWPPQLRPEFKDLQPYFTHRHELTIELGVLLLGIRVVIPSSLQDRVLQQLHEYHFGIVKMQALARQHVWWPNIDSHIELTCKSCTLCQHHAANPAFALLHPLQTTPTKETPDPSRPCPPRRKRKRPAVAVTTGGQRVKMRTFTPQQQVWVKTFSRGEEIWLLGTIIRILGPLTYMVQTGNKQHRQHVDHIREASTQANNPVPVRRPSSSEN